MTTFPNTSNSAERIHRRADGSIDFDHYRVEAQKLRAEAVRSALSQIWYWATDPRARFENTSSNAPAFNHAEEC